MQSEKTYQDYEYIDKLSDVHLKYLEKLYTKEDDRKTTIEAKLSSLLGQSGLVLSFIAIIIPISYDKLTHIPIEAHIVVVAAAFIGAACLLLSIRRSLRSYNIKNYKYMSEKPETVLEVHNDVSAFVTDNVKDLLMSIKKNREINNDKGEVLMGAQSWFNGGIIIILLSAILLAICSVMFRPEQQSANTHPEVAVMNLQKAIDSLRFIIRDVHTKESVITPQTPVGKGSSKAKGGKR